MPSDPPAAPPAGDPPDPAAPLRDALAGWIGARIDAAHVTPETGLVALSCYVGRKLVIGAGVGPRVSGVGLLPRAPRLRATAAHPLVAALRAHVVGHRLRAIEIGPEGIALVAGGEEGHVARLEIVPGRQGEARVVVEGRGVLIRWPQRGADAPAPLPPRYPADPEAAGAALVEASDEAAAGASKTALLRATKARRAALERRAEAVRGDLGRLDGISELQKLGQLLVTQGARVPKGAARAVLQDWETGGTIEVKLDPARPARAQAEDYFAKARRYQRGEAAMRGRLAETERAIAEVAALEADVAAAEARAEALEPLGQRARALGVAGVASEAAEAPRGAKGAAAKGAAKGAPRRPYHVFRSASGRAILVGRGGKDNDALITQHARPHDLWLHVKGVHGAHVVVPLDKGESCPPDLLVDAATLAAHFSDDRGEAGCEVSYVPRRYVRKPRGSAPGAVTFEREKVLVLRVEQARLARLLASKEELG